jgi:hypothetical protein
MNISRWLKVSTILIILTAAFAVTGTSQMPGDAEKHFHNSTLAAPEAFNAGDHQKAALLSEDLLRQAESWKEDWNYGNAIHYANVVLGRIALVNKEPEKARAYLLKAGKTPGSPQLKSFGPDMLFASEMLKRGETEIVLQYFDLCEKFWVMGSEQLKDWRSKVKSGGTPDFGPNVRYVFGSHPK